MSSCIFGQQTVRLARWSIEVWPWCASCRRLRVAVLTLVGITTLLPLIMIPSRIVNFSRKHQYGCRCRCFRTCAMLTSKPGISLVLPRSTRRESVSTRSTLLDPTYTTGMSYLGRRNNILCNLAGARLIGFRRMFCRGLWSVCAMGFHPKV